MKPVSSVSARGFAYAAAWLCGTALSAATIGIAALSHAPAAEVAPASPSPAMFDLTQPRLNPTMQYNGNGACTGSGCHDADKPAKHCGQNIGDESNIWKDQDPHSKASKSLSNKKSKEMAAKLKITDATAEARCLSCHGMAPAKKGAKFGKDALTNAVGCESCHGASEKWLDPHKDDCWTDKQRAAMSAAELESKLGLVDTRNLAVRGQMCVTCHLAIDADMIEAGHPALAFEMYFYNNYKFNPDWKTHWDEQPGNTHKAKIWAVGQIVSAAAADAQLKAWKDKGWKTESAEALAKVFGEGKTIAATLGPADAAGFYTEFKGKDIPKDKVAAAAKALAEKAAGFKDGAGNAQARDILTSGIEALAASCQDGGKMGKALEDKAIAAADAAKAGGDSWVKAVSEVAAAAK